MAASSPARRLIRSRASACACATARSKCGSRTAWSRILTERPAGNPERSRDQRGFRGLREKPSRGIDTTPVFHGHCPKSPPIPHSRPISSGINTNAIIAAIVVLLLGGLGYGGYSSTRTHRPARLPLLSTAESPEQFQQVIRSLPRQRAGRERLSAPRRNRAARRRKTTRKRTRRCTSSSINFRNTN